MNLLTIQKKWAAVFFSLAVGLPLALGFIPTSRTLFLWASTLMDLNDGILKNILEQAFFPALAALFFFSLPRKLRRQPPSPTPFSVKVFTVVPIFLAIGFGFFHPAKSILWQNDLAVLFSGGLWYFVFIPIGEELLFRGWMVGILEKIWPQSYFSPTNPLPVSLYMSAVAFALWHAQNFTALPWAFVCFQMLYTFVTGLWLGYLRWKSGNIYSPLAAHISINVATNLI